MAIGITPLNMRDLVLFDANLLGQILSSQVQSDTVMGFPKGRASNICIAHRSRK